MTIEQQIVERLRELTPEKQKEVLGFVDSLKKNNGPGSVNSQSLADAFAAIASDIPETEWAKVPSDLSKNLDHYLYGSDKAS